MFLKEIRLILLLKVIQHIYCDYLGLPHFESEWLTIEAQSMLSDLYVEHGLASVPGLVEVLVKAVDGPNKDFIFKAIGNGERDDDLNDNYGGIIYIYNDKEVRVMAPKRANSQNMVKYGVAIYTGDYPFWLGINNQKSLQAKVKVRCWKASELLTPCFSTTGHFMAAGSNKLGETYLELSHSLDDYPALVKVRANMIDGLDPGWYTDAQGSALISFETMRYRHLTGGLKYAYDNNTIRIWTSSWPSPSGAMFTRYDGWGNHYVLTGITTKGLVDVFAWCNLEVFVEETMHFGPAHKLEDFEIALPISVSVSQMFMTSVTVEVEDGPNKGYLFEGVGSAMSNFLDTGGQPCRYGGLIYAYNDTILRIWRPGDITGAAVCIPDTMGFGTNSQSSQNGKLIFKVYQIYEQAKENAPMRFVCSHFKLLGSDVAYNDNPIDIQKMTSVPLCYQACSQHSACATYAFHNETCQIYNTTDASLLFTKKQSQVWGLKFRATNP